MRAILLLSAAACSCSVPALSSRSPAPYEPLPPATESARPRPVHAASMPVVSLRAPAAIDVRLAAAEGAREITLEGRTLRRFQPAGRGVQELGGRNAPSFEVSAGDAGGVRFGDRSYPGTLRVLARPQGGLRLVNRVPFEDYIAGVVAAELPLWTASGAAIEAQAIACRSFALWRLQERGAVVDGVSDQVYRGLPELGQGPAARAARRRFEDALERARGQVLVRDGSVVDARFHASCGGRTTALADVAPAELQTAAAPRAAVPCGPCSARVRARDARLTWKNTVSRAELCQLARALGIGARVTTLSPTCRDEAGRWLTVRLTGPEGTRELSIQELRSALGSETLPSGLVTRTWPHAGQPIEGGLYLEGAGRGHGAGLCQTGALDLARDGMDARTILTRYFPEGRVEVLRGVTP